MADKILVGNNGALQAKYGPQGLGRIQAAIAQLIAADQARDLQTVYLAVDALADMSGVGGQPVTHAGDPRENKRAIDSIHNAHTPQYLIILGSVDVIPHQDLENPMFNPARPDDDPDRTVPSDLPYACPGPYSTSIDDFLGATRVVSRLPDVTGTTTPTYVVNLLDRASKAVTLTAADYADYLAVSAAKWTTSTNLSLTAIFGSGSAAQQVPPVSYQWPGPLLARRSQFFNCHGAPASPQYLGQLGSSYPVAHDAAYVAGKLTAGTVAAAECCYGAELYDPTIEPSGQMGMANVYLGDGAYAFWGSTTIAYGPANSNESADLICQYFLQEILGGASTGRAALVARQRFVKQASTLPPVDLKTLAQFILLGDASIECVPAPHATSAAAAAKFPLEGVSVSDSKRIGRIERRHLLSDEGLALASKAAAEGRPRVTGPDVLRRLDAIVKAAGLRDPGFLSFGVARRVEPKSFRGAALAAPMRIPTAFHVIVERTPGAGRRPAARRVVEVTEADGEIIRARELFSR